MRVLVIGDTTVNSGNEFAIENVARAWQEAAPHVQVAVLPTANTSQAVPLVWQYHAVRQNGFANTALVTVDTSDSQWAKRVAREIADAIATGILRIVVAMPRFSRPDAGAELLFHLARCAKPAVGNEDVYSAAQLVEDPQAFHKTISQVSRLFAGVDIVIGYTENVPLTGMHGMCGTAALLGDLGQDEAQAQERTIAALLFGLTKIGSPALDKPRMSLVAGNSEAAPYRDLARHDAAGSAGGAAFMLLAAGARALPLAHVLGSQFDLPQAIGSSDLIVVNQEVVDGRTHDLSTLGVVTKFALSHAVPVVALTEEQIMSTRELASHGVSACYVVTPHDIVALAARLAASWTPNR